MPLHRNHRNVLTSAAKVHFPLRMRDACVESYCSWRKVAGSVGAFAGDGVGKWAAGYTRSSAYRGPSQCLFSVTRPIGVERKIPDEQPAKDEMKRRQRSRAVERGELSIEIR
jgi:hypothetical protein